MKNNSIYKRNIILLERLFPALYNELKKFPEESFSCRILHSINGLPTIEVSTKNKRLVLHSRRDPLAEAERLLEDQTDGSEQYILVIGFGLGYHVERLLQRNKTSIIIVIEPSLYLFKQALTARDITFILRSGRIFLFHDIDSFVYDETIHSDIKTIILRPYFELFSDEILRIKEKIYSFLSRKEINIATLKRFDRLWTKNTFKNSLYFFNLPGINKLKNSLKGYPAAVICAGPSLQREIKYIKRLKNNLCVIAVDTTLKPLMKRGIFPDFTVTVDPQFINCFYMAHINELIRDQRNVPILVADPAVYPSTLKNYRGNRVLTSSVFSPGRIIEKFSGTKGNIAAGGSVSIVAFDLARLLGAEPIILLGLDLSFKSGNTHISGSLMEEHILTHINRFEPPANFYARYINSGDPVILKDKNGNRVFTDKRMLLYKSWFENQSPVHMKSVVNATRDGLDIKGIKNVLLNDLEKDLNAKKLDCGKIKKTIITKLKTEPPDFSKITLYRDYLISIKKNLHLIINLSNSGAFLSKELMASRVGVEEPRINVELAEIDEKILNFKRENQLLSMVMQTSIHEILRHTPEGERDTIMQKSLKFYQSIERGAHFLLNLIEFLLKKLKKLPLNVENSSR